MQHRPFPTLARPLTALLWLLCCAPAWAQTARPTAVPDPADPQARVAPLQHRASLTTHRATPEAEPGDWRAAHERVLSIGGWRAYLKEAAQDRAASPNPGASAPAAGARP